MEVSELCDDCPPVSYPTDKTRCLPCPRREHALRQHMIDEGVSERSIEDLVGEGWAIFEIYEAEREGGSIRPLERNQDGSK